MNGPAKFDTCTIFTRKGATVFAPTPAGSDERPNDHIASEDQVFSEPILKGFERDTGIIVKSVFGREEAKSTGVTNRLLAERTTTFRLMSTELVRADVLKHK